MILILFFILLGTASIIIQSVLLRELSVLFYGNEIFYGFGLGVWMFFTGLGSLLAGRKQLIKKRKLLYLFFFLLIVFLPLLIVFLRWFIGQQTLVGGTPGLLLAGSCLLAFFLVAFPLGMFFPQAVFLLSKGKQSTKAYLWETIGFGIGGIVFAFFLSQTSFPLPNKIAVKSYQKIVPGVKQVVNTRYSRLLISDQEGQKSYFLQGKLAFTNQDDPGEKRALNLLKPFVNQKEKALVRSSPLFTNQVEEQLGLQKTFFLQKDKQLLKAEQPLLNEQIKVVSEDARKYLAEQENNFSLLVFNFSKPETLAANRYFTKESFSLIKQSLQEEGIFVVGFDYPLDYASKEARGFAGSIFQTLDGVFSETKLLAAGGKIWMVAGQKKLSVDPEQFSSSEYKQLYPYAQQAGKEIKENLQTIDARQNKDLNPASFFYQQLFWQTIFSFSLPKIVRHLAYLLPGLLFLGLLLIFRTRRKNKLAGLAALSSFVLLSLEVVVLLFLQTHVGDLFSKVSLVYASVLVGMAFGVQLAEKKEIALGQGFLNYLFFFLFLRLSLFFPVVEYSLFWYFSSLLLGTIGGIVWQSLNSRYLETADHPAFIYAFDLFGGALGAVLTASLLLPVYGVNYLLLGLAVLVIVAFGVGK